MIIEEYGNGFKITDTDGIKYYFLAEEKNRGDYTYGGSYETMAWYLSKIVLSDRNDSIVFNYVQDSYYIQQFVTEQVNQGTQYNFDESLEVWNQTNSNATEFNRAYHTTESSNMLLTSISWRGNTISFDYEHDRTDCLFNNSNNVLPRLNTISVKNYANSIIRKVAFDNLHFVGGSSLNYRMFLEGITISGSSSSTDDEHYGFEYYTNTTLPNYFNFNMSPPSETDDICHEDYWGYYNGRSVSNSYWIPKAYTVANTQSCTDRSVSENHAKAGSITKVIYPTGGYTKYEFESNRLGNGTLWGGLRIKNICNYTEDNKLINQKSYEYEWACPAIENLGTLYQYGCYFFYHYYAWTSQLFWFYSQSYHTVSTSTPILPINADYGFPIYYATVTEYYGTKSDNIGKAVYHYEETRTNDYYQFDDTYQPIAEEPLHVYSKVYNIDHGSITTLLSSKSFFEKIGNNYLQKYSENYTYEEVSLDTFLVGVSFKNRGVYKALTQQVQYPDAQYFDRWYGCFNVMGMPSFKRLASKEVKDYSAMVTKRTDYGYDTQLRTLEPISESVFTSHGDTLKTEYIYPFSESGSIYSNMVNANKLVPVGKKVSRGGTQIERTKTTFAQYNGLYLPSAYYVGKGSNGLEQRLTFDYDSYGNLAYVSKGNLDRTVYLWGYKGMHLIAKIKGMTKSNVYNALGNTVAILLNTPTDANILSIYSNSTISNAGLSTVYTWQPLVGVTCVVKPNQERTRYEYNNFGRLTKIRNHYSQLLEEYTYNYGSTNFVRKHILTNATGNAYQEYTDYYDDFGRKAETVAKGLSPIGSDLVTLTEYDAFDRPVRDWLPTTFDCSGNYINPSTYKSTLRSYYSNDENPYSQAEYETCPSDKVIRQYGPGALWHSNSKAVETNYTGNGSNDVRKYTASDDDSSLTGNGTYASNQLFVIERKDENGNYTYIFTDKEGRLILERHKDGSIFYNTYYVYDIYGNLAFVLPPAASDLLTSGTWNITSNTTLRSYAYNYRYDSRNRCIEKKLPGCDKVTITYDAADRIIATQDGEQRNTTLTPSTYYEYDSFGRQTEMGTKTAAGVKIPLLVNYYDSYSYFSTLGSAVSNYVYNSAGGSDANYSNAKGLMTGTRVSQLDSPTSYCYTSFHYGERERLVQAHRQNHLGGINHEYFTYNFSGTVATKKLVHTASGMATQTELYTNTYDAADRLTNATYRLNNNTVIPLAFNTYDSIGRLQTKRVMNIEYIQYTYNVRSWLTGISSPRFTETLAYNATVGSLMPATNQWGGNVAAISWKTSSELTPRIYKFSYSPLDWLTAATYSGTGNYTTQYTYDKMGNFLTMKRYGLQDGGTYGIIDNLSFTYNGNQVTKIDDSVTDPTYYGAFNFMDGMNITTEYSYDKNGNLKMDCNKNIMSIAYNLLNLPSKVTFPTSETDLIYDATGKKLQAKYSSYGSVISTTDYCGNMIYEDGTLKQILVDGGYITFNGTTPVYHYYLQDHLGNNRVVCSTSGALEQVNHYYPFGGLFGQSTNGDIQRYKFNGKEFDRMHGLDWYDYGARHMSPDIGRFTSIDPMAEKYYNISPYVYCHNTPINNIDVNGNWDVTVHLAQDRTLNGYGIAVVTNRKGQEIFRFQVRGEGVKGHNRMLPENDTPLGIYDIPDNYPWIKGGSRMSYGPYHRLVMIPKSGEIKESGRDLIRIHGGRQEIQTEDGKWVKKEKPELKKTDGCLRAYDEDVKKFKEITDDLQKTDNLEKPGNVNVLGDYDEFKKQDMTDE